MFGYVRYDLPNLFVKDLMLYKAMYCGLCMGIKKACGNRARMGLTYDVAFLSALLHNIAGIDVTIEPARCVSNALKKRPIACVDELTKELGALNTVLLYYKLADDVEDAGKGRGKRLWFKKGFKRAKKQYPELVAIIEKFMKEQNKTEREKVSSCDRAADPTASMMRALSDYLLKEKKSEATGQLFYMLGKWVYLIDALDDYEKDVKKNRYNPFVLSYGKMTRAELMEKQGEEIHFLFDTLFYVLRENLARIPFAFNRDLTDNILLLGLPTETDRVMKGEKRGKHPEKI